MSDNEERRLFDKLREAARSESPPAELSERVLDHLAYRSRLEPPANKSGYRTRLVASSLCVVAAAAALAVFIGSRRAPREAAITAERAASAGNPSSESAIAAPSQSAGPIFDPCTERAAASGSAPLIDDFEDGDDAVAPLEGRAGFWRWAREIDQPGTAPALIPLPRPNATPGNRLALHVKGGQLEDWGATVEFNFRPGCYDASRYGGIGFQARGPGRIYLAPREVSVIPIAEGGTCERDCHNPHVAKIDLDAAWRVYQIRWAEVRQRGIGKPALDPQRINSLAFLIRPEDTPYDVWLDDVRFMPR